MGILKMWKCQDENEWLDGLKRYWEYVLPRNVKLEEEFEWLEVKTVQTLKPRQWYDFLLEKYFRWKFTAANRYASTTRLLKQYEGAAGLQELYDFKRELFSFNKCDIRKGLEIASRHRRPKIGLGTA